MRKKKFPQKVSNTIFPSIWSLSVNTCSWCTLHKRSCSRHRKELPNYRSKGKKWLNKSNEISCKKLEASYNKAKVDKTIFLHLSVCNFKSTWNFTKQKLLGLNNQKRLWIRQLINRWENYKDKFKALLSKSTKSSSCETQLIFYLSNIKLSIDLLLQEVNRFFPVFVRRTSHKDETLPTAFVRMWQTILFLTSWAFKHRKVLIVFAVMATKSVIL